MKAAVDNNTVTNTANISVKTATYGYLVATVANNNKKPS